MCFQLHANVTCTSLCEHGNHTMIKLCLHCARMSFKSRLEKLLLQECALIKVETKHKQHPFNSKLSKVFFVLPFCFSTFCSDLPSSVNDNITEQIQGTMKHNLIIENSTVSKHFLWGYNLKTKWVWPHN